MAPAYPKTSSEADRHAAARYHAMNNVYFLETAIHGRYPKAFVVETPYEAMGFRPGDDKIMQVPLDWIGFHYYTRRIVSDAGGGAQPGGATEVPCSVRHLEAHSSAGYRAARLCRQINLIRNEARQILSILIWPQRSTKRKRVCILLVGGVYVVSFRWRNSLRIASRRTSNGTNIRTAICRRF
ncbi:MAG: family 1 glycosylhydrolase [Terriglobales bacterium]